ncbi:MAG: glycosyltransferase [Candidatus Zixiibacteriota bacterium]|nr:MAG: glycosyltransferase [candidate division Zixibacteria bacterium]
MAGEDRKYRLSIVIPVRNEGKFLSQTLDQIYLQDFPMDTVEVAVVDGGSGDDTRHIAESYKSRFGNLKVLDNPRHFASSGKNIGIKNSSAPYVLFLTGHTYIPSKNFLADLLAAFEATGADCVCRPRPLTPPDITEFEMAVAICRSSALGHDPGSYAYSEFEGMADPTSTGAAYRRDVFERVGLFDEEFDLCNDVDFNHRVKINGLKSYISPRMRVFLYPRSTIQELWRHMNRVGRGRYKFAMKHGIFSPLQWFAGLAVLGLGLLLILALFSGAFAAILRSVVALYLLAVIGYSIILWLRDKRMGCLLYGPVIFPTIHFGIGMGFVRSMLREMLNKGQSIT